MTLLRGPLATPPRTLVDVLRRTAADHADEPAIDNGAQVLTYEEFLDAAEEVADELRDAGVGPGDKVGIRIRSGTTDLYVAIAGTLLAGAAYVPVDADDPDERARTVFGEAAVAAVLTDDLELTVRRTRPAVADGHRPDRHGRRLGDLHLRLDGGAQGCGGVAPQRRRVRRRRGAPVPAGRAARAR